MLSLLKKIRMPFRVSWGLIILCVFYIYLGFHTLSGNQGVLKWVNYEDQISSLEADIDSLQTQKISLETHADMLRAEHLDLDRLDEESRRLLNVSHPKEIVIFLDETP